MKKEISIKEKSIGCGQPVYVIAEMSANHGGEFEQAVKIIHAAKEVGADAIKLQTYTPDTMTIDCEKVDFLVGKGTLWEGRNLYELYGEAFTPWDWQPELKRIAEGIGLHLFSTPFDSTAVDYLEKMDVPAHKVASFELVDIPLLQKIGSTKKPVIMSTGMANLTEIEEAVMTLRESGCTEIAILKCTSAYPAPAEEMNLRTIPHLSEAFGCPVGLSDHTLGIAVPVAAVSLGACIIEKHFTLSRSIPGPDSAFSLEPHEFGEMVKSIRIVEKALGTITYTPSAQEEKMRVYRRSLFVVNDMKAGERFTQDSVRSIRPGYGLHPKYLDIILGRKAARYIERGTPVSWDLVG
ncbi:MAG: pseudaminic acid synthase [Deltaproteobacteria bacterium]|nr:pseudaminic acid synthase [Deltaproteobacteria bacterium]